MNVTKKKQPHRYRKQTSMGLKDINISLMYKRAFMYKINKPQGSTVQHRKV